MVNDTLLNFGKRYKDDLSVIFDQWLKLHLDLDALSNQKILKGIYYQTHALWNYKHMWLALNSICNKLPPQRKHAQYANCGFYVIALDISTTLVSSKPQISWFPQHTKAICIRYHIRIFQQFPLQMVG